MRPTRHIGGRCIGCQRVGADVQFTIDTDTDSYEDALRTLNAAYNVPDVSPPPPAARRLQPVPDHVPDGEPVWQNPDLEWAPAWTEPLLAEWVALLPTADSLCLAWRLCQATGREGVLGAQLRQALADYAPANERKLAVRLSVAVREGNKAAREAGQARMPFTRDIRHGHYKAHPRVAEIVLEQLEQHHQFAELTLPATRP